MPAASEAAPRSVPTVLRPAALEKLSPGPGRSAAEVADHQRARIHDAMLELVAERGYGSVRARELARLAGVSTRAYYELFGTKEECFLRTYELVARRIAGRLFSLPESEEDWRERVRLAFDAFFAEIADDPRVGRLALIEVYGACPDGSHRLRRLERTFEERLEEDFAHGPDGVEAQPLLVRAVVAGMIGVARSRLLAGREDELHALPDRLAEWACSLRSGTIAEPTDFTPQIKAPREWAASSSLGLSSESTAAEGKARAPQGERDLFLSAVAKLAAVQGYEGITERNLCDAAGASQRSFRAHFAGIEDCLLEAAGASTREVLARAAAARSTTRDWSDGINRAVGSICADVAADPVFASLHFDALFAMGRPGLECRERLMAEARRCLCEAGPARASIDELEAEASVDAIWGVLGQCVASGQAGQAPHLSPALAQMVSMPVPIFHPDQTSQPSSNR